LINPNDIMLPESELELRRKTTGPEAIRAFTMPVSQDSDKSGDDRENSTPERQPDLPISSSKRIQPTSPVAGSSALTAPDSATPELSVEPVEGASLSEGASLAAAPVSSEAASDAATSSESEIPRQQSIRQVADTESEATAAAASATEAPAPAPSASQVTRAEGTGPETEGLLSRFFWQMHAASTNSFVLLSSASLFVYIIVCCYFTVFPPTWFQFGFPIIGFIVSTVAVVLLGIYDEWSHKAQDLSSTLGEYNSLRLSTAEALIRERSLLCEGISALEEKFQEQQERYREEPGS
jgi:hypothetical protein